MLDPDSVLEAIATTRAIRRIRPDRVPDDDLRKILFAATRAPSGSNRQPFRFLVLRDGPNDREAKAVLGAAFRAGWAAKVKEDRYDEGSALDPSTRKGRTALAMQRFVETFETIPVVVLACLERYRDPNPLEGSAIYPACQNLLLAARALGYGGVLTQWHGFVEADLRRILSIPEGVAIHAVIPLGRPEGRHGPVRRRPLAEVVFEGGWGQPPAWAG